MKWLTPFALLLVFGLFVGCDDDDNGTDNNGPTAPRVVASILTTPPPLDDPDADVWTDLDSTTVTVAGSNVPKLGAPKATATPATMLVQAAVDLENHLYLRVQWADPTYDAYPGHYTVTTLGPPLAFTYVEAAQEDQLFVMFQDPLTDEYDVWNWQALSTAGAFVAQGMWFAGDSLTVDSNATATLPAALENREANFQLPQWLPRDSSEFQGAVLAVQDAVERSSFDGTGGWAVGDTIPGWLVDTALVGTTHTDEQRGSIWDTRVISVYDDAASEYRVVFQGPIASTYDDDLDLASLDSLQVIIGVFDNQYDFDLGGTGRAFSQKFWLILPSD